MGKFTKFFKGCDLFGNDFKFFITNKKNTFNSTIGGFMSILYVLLLICAGYYSIRRYFTSLPEIDIYNDVERSIEGEYDSRNFNSVSDLMNMKLVDKFGSDYHRLYIHSKYKNLSNEKVFSRIEILRPNSSNNYKIDFDVSILKEVEVISLKIFYTPCRFIKRLNADIIKNDDLLDNCNYNITQFYESLKTSNSLKETVKISFNTHKVSINPFVKEKYSYDSKMQIDFVKLNYVKSKNVINFKWYYFIESRDWNTNTSFAIDLDYEVGYPVYVNNTESNQGYYEEFTININKQKNYVHINYMNLYEIFSLFGGIMNFLTFLFRFITKLFTKNNVQIYKMIKEFKKESKSYRPIEVNHEGNNSRIGLDERLNINSQINNVSSINYRSFYENDNYVGNTLAKFEEGYKRFCCFRLNVWFCCNKNDQRNDIIDYVKDSFSIFNLQRKINELELMKNLLDEDKIRKIRELSELNNPKMISVRFMEFKKDEVDVRTISDYVKRIINQAS